MAVASNDEGKKWIQTSVALVCITLGYVLVSFFEKLSEWFAMEAMIPYYSGLTQAVSVLIALAVYFYILRTPKSAEFLTNVYHEVMKVVWPDTQQTWRHTFVIMIAVTIMGFVFGFFDFAANFLLGLVNK
ncbi:MAG TPA: preprotein translocase subunit SecE [Bacteriovoracaceae bacterium]|nr:preprotein translocase subunit SecE [Bacteriovoracaceae bacterium]